MSQTDVFWLTSSIAEFLPAHFPDVEWAKNVASDGAPPDFKYPQHPGAASYAQGSTPWFVHGASYLFLAVFVPAILALLQRGLTSLGGLFFGSPTPVTDDEEVEPIPSPTLAKGFEALDAELEVILSRLETHQPALTVQEAADVAEKIRRLRGDVAQSFQARRIDRKQRDSLRSGLRNAQIELEQLQPPSTPVPDTDSAPAPAKATKKKP